MGEAVWDRYWRRAVWVTMWLRYVPYVRMVGLNGSMATGSVKESSDIDFFVVAEPGHLYTARFLVTAVVQLLGLRRHGKHVAGRICLNRYATTDFMDITEHTEYHARVFHNLYPLYAAPGVYKEYRRVNAWMGGFGYEVAGHSSAINRTRFGYALQKTGELYVHFAWIEQTLRRYQQKKVWANKASTSNGSIVVTTDQELRFHLNKELYG